MTWSPSQPRVPSGQAGGGRWGAAAATKKGGKAPAARSSAHSSSRAAGGPARNAAAAAAQANPGARGMYDKLTGLPPGQRAAYLHSLSDGDLKLLTQIAYSSRTSDPEVVKARIAVANEMGKRGIDIKKYGALGGGNPAPASHGRATVGRHMTPAQHVAVAHARARTASHASSAAKPTAAGAGRKRAI